MKRRIAAVLCLVAALMTLTPAALAEEETPETPAPAFEESAAPELSPTPTPTLTPTPTPTATPTATPEPTAEPTAEPSATPETLMAIDARVTIGADLTATQIAAIYADFGIKQGDVKQLIVTNAEERSYLEGLVPEKKIGTVALSCLYIQTLPEGSGLTITLNNINYCTDDMYKNALETAGIKDARVMVSAPYPVSGTGALTGAYKAYEDITGVSLSSLAKAVGAEELVVTGELAEYIGSDEAAALIAELKTMLDKTVSMTDAEVRSEIEYIAKLYNVSLTEGQINQVLSLVRKLEGLDEEELQNRLTSLAKTAQTAGKASETVTRVYESVKSFFAAVGDFFSKIFGKK